MALTRVTIMIGSEEPLSDMDLQALAGGLTGEIDAWMEHWAIGMGTGNAPVGVDGEVFSVVAERVDGHLHIAR